MIHVILFMLGCCIGSFLNVIFSRRDWYKGRSRCDGCGYVLKWYDLIPVVSFLILRGKCRKCKTKIDSSHLVSELIMGAAFLVSSFLFLKYGTVYGSFIAVSIISMAVAAIEDCKEQMVYNFILTGGIILSASLKCYYYTSLNLYIAAINLVVCVFIFKLISLILSLVFEDKIGAGDFDALIIIYIIGDFWGLIVSLTLASLLGCFFYMPSIILKKRDKNEPLPFIPFLFMGTMIFLLLQGVMF